MKKLPVFALLLLPVLAHADLVVEQKMESAMVNGNITMKIKGDQARVDSASPAGPQTVIFNTKTGDMTSLMHAQKMAMKMNLNAMKKQAEAAQKAMGIDPSKIEKPKSTGQKEKIGEWNAEIYTFNVAGMQGRLWVAKDFPNAKAINDQVTLLSSQMGGNAGVDPSKFDLGGMVVKSEMTTPAGRMATTLISAKEQPVPDAEFAVPQGYQEMKMPAQPPAAR